MVNEQTAERAGWFHALPVATAVFDTHGRVLEANAALGALLGYPREELLRLSAVDLLHPGERADEFTGDERRLVRADGHCVFCDMSSIATTRGDGSRAWLTTFVDVGQRRHDIGVLEHEASHDELTGLLNRRGTKELLSQLLTEEAAEADRQVAVLFCDIDNFKRINDALGHEVGDELLVALAQRLEAGLPHGCTPARHSGDEFLVICSDLVAAGGLEKLTDEVLRLLRTTAAPHGYVVGVSASIGAATVHHSAQTPEDLLRFADTAMYHAKDQGPGRVVRADPALVASVEHEVRLEGDLCRALAHDELELHYQPVVDGAGNVIGAEALLRWPHPQHGWLSPGVILPAARHAGLLNELDRWVLRTAVRQAAVWPEPHGPVGVAVNLGSQLLHEPDFGSTVTEIVTDAALSWHRLILEISETDLLDLAPGTHEAMSELVARGARFAVDDFGTGYSTLERLKELPVQVIKLDRTFVAGIEDNPVDAAIAGAALSIAHARNSTCVAEGVETTGQLYRLAALGYDTFQGFLFAGAVPAPELHTLITRGGSRALPSTELPPQLEGEHSSTSEPDTEAARAGGRRQGEVTDARNLVPDGHLCWAYQHPDDFQARAREYALDGLSAGQQVEYVGNAPTWQLRAQLAADDALAGALDTGALKVSSVHEAYRAGAVGLVDPDAAVAVRIDVTNEALAAGYSGFRTIVDATEMVRTRTQREAFAHFEYLIDHVMSHQPVTALCAYDLAELGSAAVAEIACLHPLTSPQTSPFRLYTDHPNTDGSDHLALAGHIDLPCAALLAQALRHAQHDELIINDRGLTFLDRHALQVLDHHAREHDQHVLLRLAQPLATRLTPLPDLTHTRIEPTTH
ncbi:EAL domain-containing protein [Saccharopolyspora sp. NPDC049357]|uniref:EAL domain-containing protein n=1 Tax=Saccharopolyspora sp. NPDC049357 TaxID=3154507 RepID=UPI0034385C28